MSSLPSNAALGRARSLRKPTTRSDTAADGNDQINGVGVGGASQQRSTSPSRLPVKGLSLATGTGERTLRRAVGEVRGSRPLSAVFAGGRAVSTTTGSSATGAGVRQVSSAGTNPGLGRAPSTRQVSVSSASTTNGETGSGTGSGTTRLTRAASIRQLSGAASGRSGSEGSGVAPPRRAGTTTATGEPPTPLSRRPTVTEATTTTTTTGSSRRPTTSSGLPPKRTASTAHSRAKSSVTALSSTTILRPPSATSQTSTATSTSTEKNDRSKPPITRGGVAPPPPPAPHKRAPSHPISGTQPSPSTPGVSRAKSLRLEGPGGVVKAAVMKKPEFNTHQQHFSPLKNPGLAKPLTSAILAPPSPSKLPANVAISAETARLQTELLQLSLLHQAAGETRQQWEGSAYEKLKERFDGLVGQEEEVLKLENRNVESIAVKELLQWGGGKRLEERVRVLDEVLGVVWALTEPGTEQRKGGRYLRVVGQFEKWLGKAEETLAARRTGGGAEAGGLVEEIGREWKEELGGVSRKVHAARQDLHSILEGYELGDDKEKTSLGRVLTGVKDLVEGMVSEIEIMEVVEKEVREQEMEWVRRVNRVDEGVETKRRAGAVWRAF
ncbi:hypothetical protein QBC41DRAFT_367215 [Cercophora samala]|uniref:Uncharacterized protein n=1 Tax=Cercophora samala TaxID=330535 RepID=A0AA39Z868_9PEZI|nr:hypothetical protein QBC41DRAFT_367215 [Cercophora samala]